MEATGHQKIDVANIKESIGKYIVLWRNEVKEAAKILEVEGSDRRMLFELVSGPDKGKRYKSRYDANKPLDIYDDDTLVLALIETQIKDD